MDRRSLLLAALAAGAAPVVAGPGVAHADAPTAMQLAGSPVLAGEGPGRAQAAELNRLLNRILGPQLEDEATVSLVMEWIREVMLTWRPETEPLSAADYIVAFSFGNRPPAGGADPAKVLAEPGPVNEQLADVIAAMRKAKQVPVYAQWEIARVLESKHRMSDVVSIEPDYQPDGTIVYLSTDDVARKVAQLRAKAAAGAGRASVVGFRDHHKRCVLTCRINHLTAHAPEGYPMPSTYDPDSGQVWTRSRPVYLAADVAGQFLLLERALVEAASRPAAPSH